MRDADAAPARETVAYWVLVELRAAAAQAKTHTVRASERYVASDARRCSAEGR
jgi:hypothetical protein